MSAPTNDGGPAFPFIEPATTCNVSPGMTLRDYFAAKALSGISHLNLEQMGADDLAVMSYAMADAMLKAREVQP